jgi:MFS family permease
MFHPSKTSLAAFYAANVLFGAGLFFHGFLYNFYLTALGKPESVMGLAAASLTAGGVLSLLPAGALVDRVGSKPAFYLAAAAASSGLALGALAQQPSAIYAAAALAGAGTVTWRVTMGPLLMGLTSDAQRTRAFSWNVAFMVGSGALWMAAAGEAASWLELAQGFSKLWATRVAMLIGVAGTVLAVPAFALGGFRGPAPRAARGAPSGLAVGRRRLERLAVPAPLAWILLGVLFWMIAPALVLPFFNLFFLREHHLSVDRIGVFFGLAHAVTALVLLGSGELAARWGPRATLSAWSLLFGPVMGILAGVQGTFAAGAFYLVQGFVSPATNPLIDQLVLERAPADRRGVASSWRNAATEVGGLLGAAVGGYVLQAFSFGALFMGTAVFSLAAAATLITLLRPRP